MKRYLFPIVAMILALLALYTIARADTYTQPLNCAATAISLNSPSTSATVTCPGPTPPPSTGCYTIGSTSIGISNYQRWSGTQSINYLSGGTRSADVTEFAKVFNGWPGVPKGLYAIGDLPVNRYWSMQFTVPANADPRLYGQYQVGETGYSARLSLSIAEHCGDFSNPTLRGSTVLLGCWKNVGGPVSGPIWSLHTGVAGCMLQPGRTYWLNVIAANVADLLPNGGGKAGSTKNAQCKTTCSVPIYNGIFGP